MSADFSLSIAVPIHNEEAGLPELLTRTLAVLDSIPGGPHQLLFVDDGSTDRSLGILEEAAHSDPRIMVVSLSRNFGHQLAFTAALDYVIGDAVVLMDGDLQDIPEAIPLFVERFMEGYDVVYATRATRKEGLALKLCYSFFYRFQAILSETRLPLDTGDFSSLCLAASWNNCAACRKHHRYLRGLRSWVGFKQVAIPIDRSKRLNGKSKYSVFKLLQLASDGIFAFSLVPLRAATLIGALAISMAGFFALYTVYAKFFLHHSPQGFTAIVLLTTFLSGVLLFFMGIIGEYVGRIYEESKGRPLYVVNKTVGWVTRTTDDRSLFERRSVVGPKREGSGAMAAKSNATD